MNSAQSSVVVVVAAVAVDDVRRSHARGKRVVLYQRHMCVAHNHSERRGDKNESDTFFCFFWA